MSKKLTPWFACGVNPVHVGVYEVAPDRGSPWYSYWDGVHFQGICKTIDDAVNAIPERWDHVDLTWRGLSKKP